MSHSRKKGIFISIAVTFILLAALELVVRLLAGAEPGDAAPEGEPVDFQRHALVHRRAGLRGLIYELKPGASVEIQGRMQRINAHGMRDREVSMQKAPGRFRIAVVGDSFTFGWRVFLEDCYVKQLEKLLNDRADRPDSFEVLNFGVCGYNTEQQMILLEEKVLAFDPDLVIVGFVTNDIMLPASPLALFFLDRHDPVEVDRLRRAERLLVRHLPRQAEEILPPWLSWSRLACTLSQRIEETRRGDLIANYYDDEEMWTALRFSLRDVKSLLQRRQIPVFVALFPEDLRELSRATRIAIHEKLRFALGAMEFPFVDLLDVYRREPAEKIIIDPIDSHPSCYGHAIAARAICDALVEKGLVP